MPPEHVPAGIATQREDLRKKFTATPDDVVRFFTSVAEEVREILALMGATRLSEIIGCTDRIEQRIPETGKASTIRLDRLLAGAGWEAPRHMSPPKNEAPLTGTAIDQRALASLRISNSVVEPTRFSSPITNADRSVGARIAGELTTRTHAGPIAPRSVELHLRGTAGQSFGAFCVQGMRLVLTGSANDYVGKSMSGGEIVVRAPRGSTRTRDVIGGNTILYGATGGTAHFAGRVGERFAVRNSGAVAVCEGAGDHAGEYMTAGALLLLGATGRNLGAGMTGGVIYALDVDELLESRIHHEWVSLDARLSAAEEQWVHELVARHIEATDGYLGRQLYADWSSTRRSLKRIMPVGSNIPAVLPELPALDASAERRQGRGRVLPAKAKLSIVVS